MLDIDTVWLPLIIAAVIGGVGLLLNRLNHLETLLHRHGMKLVRIETKLGIPDASTIDA